MDCVLNNCRGCIDSGNCEREQMILEAQDLSKSWNVDKDVVVLKGNRYESRPKER